MSAKRAIFIYKCISLTCFLCITSLTSFGQLISDNQVKTGLIYNYARYITWEKENLIDTFKIGFYGDDNNFLAILKTTEQLKVKNKPISVIEFKSLADFQNTQILVITSSRNYFIRDILDLLKGKNTLLVTDKCEYQRYVMINFFYQENSKIQFEINSRNLEEARLKTSPKLILLGGSEIDVRKLYVETEKSLVTAKERADNYEKELLQKQTEIAAMNLKLQQLVSDLTQFQGKINAQRNELNNLTAQSIDQKRDLDEKLKILQLQKNEISNRENQLAKKDKEISLKQSKIEEYSQILIKQKAEIDNRQETINKQGKTLVTQTDKIRSQLNFMYLLVCIALMAIALVLVILKYYKINRKKNEQLQIINTELNRSRDEISVQAEQLELKNVELEKLSLVASKTDNAVIIMNEKSEFEWVNEGFHRLYGFTLEEFSIEKGNNLRETSSYKDIKDILDTVEKDKKSATYEAPAISADSRKIWIHSTLTPIFDENNFIKKLIVIDSDITQLKEAELNIIEKNEEIQRQSEELFEQAEHLTSLNHELELKKNTLENTLEKLKSTQTQLVESEKMIILGQLTAGIAHEINNPINYINSGIEGINMAFAQIYDLLNMFDQLNAENIKEKLAEIEDYKEKIDYKNLLPDITQLTKDIKSGINRTVEIIKGLRTFSRLDETDLKNINLHSSLDSTLVILRNKYNNRIEIVKNYGIIPEIECYPGKINQVFLNILVNAIQAIKNEGFIYITTELLASDSADKVLISIRDTGSGMSNEVKRKIFEPFYTTKDVGEGTGLGLSITYNIIESHNGSIEVDSEPGTGTTFKISLPVSFKKKDTFPLLKQQN